jgi:transcriptional antiterminator NusG
MESNNLSEDNGDSSEPEEKPEDSTDNNTPVEDKSDDTSASPEDVSDPSPAPSEDASEEITSNEDGDSTQTDEVEPDEETGSETQEDELISGPADEEVTEPTQPEQVPDDEKVEEGDDEPKTEDLKDESTDTEPVTEQVQVEDAEEEPQFEKGIFAIKTSIGHEKMVADTLEGRVRRRKADVYSIMLPPNLRGYLLIEALDNREALRDLIKGVQHARTLVEGTTSIEEIEGFLTPKPIVSGIEEGDIVEVIAGPFKGEKAKVKQIDVSKEEITIELFEAMVSIPVTIRGDHVRVLEKESS